MSSSVDIPSLTAAYDRRVPVSPAAKPHSASSSSCGTVPGSPATPGPLKTTPSPQSPDKKKQAHNRRPSLLSSALSRQVTTVVNIGKPDGPPRLISYLSSSQGFAWNPQIFLPSYLELDYVPLENHREPVHDIELTDEEVAKMFPK